MTPVRFGLIGCGKIAQRFAQVLAKLPGAVLAGVASRTPDGARAFGERHGVPWFASAGDLLAQAGVQVACVLTPSGAHADAAVAAARAGCHVVVEKPIALTLADADRMIAAADEAQVKLFVVKQNRWNRAVLRLKAAVDAGRFGKLVLGAVRLRWCREQAYYEQAAWRGTAALDGSVLANQASHHVDLLRWLMGEPAAVSAMTAARLARIETADTAGAVIRFRSGALGIVEATTGARPRDLEGSLSLLGERGSVELGGFTAGEVRTWQFVEPEPDDARVQEESQTPAELAGYGHARFLAAVVACVRGEGPAPLEGREARKTLELVVAMERAARSGQEERLG